MTNQEIHTHVREANKHHMVHWLNELMPHIQTAWAKTHVDAGLIALPAIISTMNADTPQILGIPLYDPSKPKPFWTSSPIVIHRLVIPYKIIIDHFINPQYAFDEQRLNAIVPAPHESGASYSVIDAAQALLIYHTIGIYTQHCCAHNRENPDTISSHVRQVQDAFAP